MLEGIVVSCQARPDNPLHGPLFMSAMAVSAVQGGATAIRANGVKDIRSIKAHVKVPIIGINKIFSDRMVPLSLSGLDKGMRQLMS